MDYIVNNPIQFLADTEASVKRFIQDLNSQGANWYYDSDRCEITNQCLDGVKFIRDSLLEGKNSAWLQEILKRDAIVEMYDVGVLDPSNLSPILDSHAIDIDILSEWMVHCYESDTGVHTDMLLFKPKGLSWEEFEILTKAIDWMQGFTYSSLCVVKESVVWTAASELSIDFKPVMKCNFEQVVLLTLQQYKNEPYVEADIWNALVNFTSKAIN